MLELNTIHNIDALEGFKKIDDESVDLIVTDPPYNLASKNRVTKKGSKIISTKEAWGAWDCFHPFDYDLLIMQIISQSFRSLKSGGSLYMFTSGEDNGVFIRMAVARGFRYRNQLAIVKVNPLPSFYKNNWRHAVEVCMYLTKGRPATFNFLSQRECNNVFMHALGRKETQHPTEKPLAFVKKLVQVSSNRNELVLDPFMGSGTTAVACEQLGRNFLGFELNAEYITLAKRRLRNGER